MFKSPAFEARTQNPAGSDVEIVAIFQDSGKKPIPPKGGYTSLVDRLKKGGSFTARSGSLSFVRFGGKGSVESCLLVGMGQASELTEERARQAGALAWSKCMAEKSGGICVNSESFTEARGLSADLKSARVLRAFAEGIALSAYQFEKYRIKPKNSERKDAPARVCFVVPGKGSFGTQLEKDLKQVSAIATAVNLTRDWSNEPSNFGTPEYYASEARKLARTYGLKCRVLTESEAAREKMGLFLGVGQGAEREGRVVVVEYSPKGSGKRSGAGGTKTLAFVGKGVTFDSGGISIKPSMRMEDMKHDMTGAATVMGGVLLASLWKVPNRVIGIMGFTENMPDGHAIQPGNVLKSRNGKTVEIINTDAEGRLVLADILDYAQDMRPDAIVDVATLTGAVSVALGKQCCAILGNDEGLIDTVKRAGESSGEKIWQLPLFDEYFEDLKSDHADMKNSANDSNGGTIRGAIFLKQFIRPGQAWAHLDIAAMAWGLTHLPYYPKRGASGIYVRTLAQLAAEY